MIEGVALVIDAVDHESDDHVVDPGKKFFISKLFLLYDVREHLRVFIIGIAEVVGRDQKSEEKKKR